MSSDVAVNAHASATANEPGGADAAAPRAPAAQGETADAVAVNAHASATANEPGGADAAAPRAPAAQGETADAVAVNAHASAAANEPGGGADAATLPAPAAQGVPADAVVVNAHASAAANEPGGADVATVRAPAAQGVSADASDGLRASRNDSPPGTPAPLRRDSVDSVRMPDQQPLLRDESVCSSLESFRSVVASELLGVTSTYSATDLMLHIRLPVPRCMGAYVACRAHVISALGAPLHFARCTPVLSVRRGGDDESATGFVNASINMECVPAQGARHLRALVALEALDGATSRVVMLRLARHDTQWMAEPETCSTVDLERVRATVGWQLRAFVHDLTAAAARSCAPPEDLALLVAGLTEAMPTVGVDCARWASRTLLQLPSNAYSAQTGELRVLVRAAALGAASEVTCRVHVISATGRPLRPMHAGDTHARVQRAGDGATYVVLPVCVHAVPTTGSNWVYVVVAVTVPHTGESDALLVRFARPTPDADWEASIDVGASHVWRLCGSLCLSFGLLVRDMDAAVHAGSDQK